MNVKTFKKGNDLVNHKKQLWEEFRGSMILELQGSVEKLLYQLYLCYITETCIQISQNKISVYIPGHGNRGMMRVRKSRERDFCNLA